MFSRDETRPVLQSANVEFILWFLPGKTFYHSGQKADICGITKIHLKVQPAVVKDDESGVFLFDSSDSLPPSSSCLIAWTVKLTRNVSPWFCASLNERLTHIRLCVQSGRVQKFALHSVWTGVCVFSFPFPGFEVNVDSSQCLLGVQILYWSCWYELGFGRARFKVWLMLA